MDSFTQLGLIFLNQQDFERAHKYIGQANKLNPSHGPTLLALSQLCLDIEDLDKAIEYINKLEFVQGLT